MSLDLAALEKPITRILRAPGTDLSTISAKRVRKALLEDPAYAHLRLTAEVLKTRRGDVDEVISRMFQEVSREASRAAEDGGDDGGEGGGGGGEGDGDEEEAIKEEEEAEVAEELEEPEPPRPKRTKTARSVEESDAALARRLSTEINSRSRRGASSSLAAGSSSSSPRKGKRKPKKSAARVASEDEADGERPKKRRGAKGGFAKEYTLSVPLSAVLEAERMSRPQVVKKLWEYIRRHALQNPSNKREILCDDALRAVFSVDKIDMFKMNKVLGSHLHE